MTINKNRKRRPHDPNRVVAIKATAKKFSVTDTYVRAIVRGSMDCGQAADIKAYFNQVFSNIKNIVK